MSEQFPTTQQIGAMTIDELKDQFALSLEYTAKHLVYLGQLWLEMENRGEDLSELKKGIAVYVPMIAHSRLDARLVIAYAGQKTLLTALSALPINEQKTLAELGKVTYVNPENKQSKDVDLIDINARMIPQIFSDSNVRTVEEQLRLINKAEFRPKKSVSKPRLVSKVKVADDCIVVSNKRITIDTAINALSDHFGKDLRNFLKNSNR